MSKRLLSFVGGIALALTTAGVALAQDSTTTTTTTTTQQSIVQNSDGTWTVVEYPADREVTVDLTPSSTVNVTTATRARVLRTANGTVITVDPAGFANTTGMNLYAVDSMGHVTLLGPINAASTTPLTFNTNLNRFMLVVSPEGNLRTYAPKTSVAYRSVVPTGLAVIPLSSSGDRDGAAVGERVSATSSAGATSAYNVPMLGIPGFRQGTDTHMKINFAGNLSGVRANAFIKPRKDGATQILLRFHELKQAPPNTRLVLWAVSPDNKFVRLGQVINTGSRNEGKIATETSLRDFGLFVTVEATDDVATPSGAIISDFTRMP